MFYYLMKRIQLKLLLFPTTVTQLYSLSSLKDDKIKIKYYYLIQNLKTKISIPFYRKRYKCYIFFSFSETIIF